MADNSLKNSYEFDGRVRYSEIGHRGTMTLPLGFCKPGLQYLSVRGARTWNRQAETG